MVLLFLTLATLASSSSKIGGKKEPSGPTGRGALLSSIQKVFHYHVL